MSLITIPKLLAVFGTVLVALMGFMKFLFTQVFDLGKTQLKMATELGELKGRQEGTRETAQKVLDRVSETTRRSCEVCENANPKE